MSWCGGGLMSVTPGVECRSLAIRLVTLKPGNCPPSPGLAPWAILISISRQLFRYSAVTPNRPELICLIAELALSPLARGFARSGSSPPSPLSLRAPMRFMAMLSVSCASGLSAPKEMPGATSRLRISVMLSTSSTSMALTPSMRKSSRSRSATGFCRRTPSA